MRAALLAIGLLLVGVLVFQLDAPALWRHLTRLGWALVPVLVAYVGMQVLSAASWRACVDPAHSSASFGLLLQAMWAGHALNAVGAGAGEVLKGALLVRRWSARRSWRRWCSTTPSSGSRWRSWRSAAPCWRSCCCRSPARCSAGLLAASAVVAGGLGLGYFLLHRGAAGLVVRGLAKLPLMRLRDPAALVDKAAEVDRRVARFRSARPGAFRAAVLYAAGVRALQVLEVWVMLLALMPDRDAGFLLLFSVVVQTTTQLLSWAGAFVPGQVGVLEGGAALLFQVAAMDPVIGLAVALVRRARRLVGVLIGLVLGVIASRA